VALKELNQRAATKVARNIVSDIQKRSLRPGSKLDPEHIMVAKQGAARGTVREALRLLEFQGTVRIKAGPRGGPEVAVPEINHLASTLSLQLQFANATFRSVLDARKSIYQVLASEAASHATHQDIVALRESLARLKMLTEDSRKAARGAIEFNELIARASKNLVLSYLVNALHQMSEHESVEYSAYHWRSYFKQCEQLLEAVEAGEEDQARYISQRTHQAGIRYWEKNYSELLEKPIEWTSKNYQTSWNNQ
jgi:GntR family transcriptional repressor for pyruvate dehydrogenase complex